MNIEKLRDHCLKKNGVSEGFPFGEDVLIFKVLDKMFLGVRLAETPMTVNAKAKPERAIELREKYEAVQPGYHMNKKHWNTITLDGSIPDKTILGWIDDSYMLIASGLKKAQRAELGLE